MAKEELRLDSFVFLRALRGLWFEFLFHYHVDVTVLFDDLNPDWAGVAFHKESEPAVLDAEVAD